MGQKNSRNQLGNRKTAIGRFQNSSLRASWLLEGIHSHQIASFPNRKELAKNLLDCVEITLAKTVFIHRNAKRRKSSGIVQEAEKESSKEPRGGFLKPGFRFASTRTCTREDAANAPEIEPEGDADPDPDPGPKTLATVHVVHRSWSGKYKHFLGSCPLFLFI